MIDVGDKVTYIKQTHRVKVNSEIKVGMSGVVVDKDNDFNLNHRVVFIIDGGNVGEWFSEDELEVYK